MMEKIAIIGLSCLFPDAANPEQFWQNLVEQKDSRSEATAEQMGVEPTIFYDPHKGTDDKFYYLQGGYIKNFHFDPTLYKLPAESLAGFDDLFQWSLYVARQALLDSGYIENATALASCGAILGTLCFPTKSSHRLLSPLYDTTVESALRELLQCEDFYLTNRVPLRKVSPYNALLLSCPATIVAQALALGGIHFSLDASYASSLYAVKLACQYLLAHKTDMMLAGAVSCADPLFVNMLFSCFHAHPDNGISQPFDRLSTGLTTAEGASVFVLKRYSDALRDHDKVYATICGVGLSNDGEGKHLLAPNPKGQVLAFERAYADAKLDPKSIDYVECHATGTPVGDITELNSLDTFFGCYTAAPLMGSVKANTGHLLSAAGMAGMLKVILSMNKGIIPATMHVTAPLSSRNGVMTPQHLVSSTRPWPHHRPTKYAAVNAFGFGGTNAHLILTQGSEELLLASAQTVQAVPVPTEKMAIVGMEICWGGSAGLDDFDRCVYEGVQHCVPVPRERWKGMETQPQLLREYGFDQEKAPQGAYMTDFDIDLFATRILPNEADLLNPQHLLMLKVADRAVRDARLEKGANVAVIIATASDLSVHQLLARWDISWQMQDSLAKAHISLPSEKLAALATLAKDRLHSPLQIGQGLSYLGNLMACRIAALWDFSGAAFVLSAGENSVFKALEVAQMLLSAREVDAVVVGAVDFAGGAENVLLRQHIATHGDMVGEGAGAVVVKRYDTAQQEGDHLYAVVDAISLVQGSCTPQDGALFSPPPAAEAVEHACLRAFAMAEVSPADIGYLEVFGSGVGREQTVEISGLTKAYRTPEAGLCCAIGNAKVHVGHSMASGMASVIKTALCLYHRYIPGMPQWSGPNDPELWEGSPFYVPPEPRPWFVDGTLLKRTAAINGFGLDGTHAHLILSEAVGRKKPRSRYLAHMPFYLFPIAADDRTALLEKLYALQQAIDHSSSLATLASQTFNTFQNHAHATYTLALVGHNKDELHQEIQSALRGTANAFDTGGEWKTPLGSYFTAAPLGKKGTIAFVYPGAFNSYIRLGSQLFRLFPEMYERFGRLTSRIGIVLREKLLYPRSLHRLSKKQLETLEEQFLDNAIAMIESGVSFSALLTMIMREYFQVHPKVALGYSLGESSMLCALGVWKSLDRGFEGLRRSPLFSTRLVGPLNAVREFWGQPQRPHQEDEELWHTYTLLSSASVVMDLLEQESDVYLTHINTPEEVVIAGNPASCVRVIETLQCDYFRLPSPHALHCAAMRSEYHALVALLTAPVRHETGITFYSAAHCAPLRLDSQDLAQNLAQALCERLDFPRLINRVYADGARIFIELGAGSTCSRWISETLKQQEHVTVSINKRGVEDHTAMIRGLAALLSHRITLDLSSLYGQVPQRSSEKSLVKTVTLGGRRIKSTIETDENKKKFGARAARSAPDPISPELVPEVRLPALHHLQYQKLSANLSLSAKGHTTFLQARGEALQHISALIQLQIAAVQQGSATPGEQMAFGDTV